MKLSISLSISSLLSVIAIPVLAQSNSMPGMNMSGMSTAGQHESAPAGVSVKDAWIRALPSAVPSGGYFTLHNGGMKTVVLTGAASPGCGMLMLHKTEDKGGMSSMMDVAQIQVRAGETVKFSPGGYHLMCMDAKPSIKPGAKVPVTLIFKTGDKITVPFDVRNASGQ